MQVGQQVGRSLPSLPLAGGLGRSRLGFSEDYLSSASNTHTLSQSTHVFNCPKTRSEARAGRVKAAPTFQNGGRKWENVWRKCGKGREGIEELANWW